ncbi:MAG: PD40 domain-containing protein [Muribaculaceae bacterium]|nr:PD40 domain-containing protein [Muribaculaceae bacterium]
MKKLLILAAILLAQSAMAQGLKQGTLSNVKRLTTGTEMYENPRWSPDGTKIAFTRLGYDGLYIIDANGTAVTQISDDLGVGYQYQWSADSHEILVRDTRWENNATGTMRLHAAWSIDMKGKKVRLSEDAEYMQPAAWRYSPVGEKSIMCVDAPAISGIKLKAVSTAVLQTVAKSVGSNISFYVDGDNLYKITARGTKVLINQGPSFAPALSPDGTKVAFNQMDDVCVMNIDGTGKKVIGAGYNASWVNNNQIVFERTTDDGHTYLTGELYMASIDGSNIKKLTSTADKIEMNPSVSPDGTKVVFTSFVDGQVYIADLK